MGRIYVPGQVPNLWNYPEPMTSSHSHNSCHHFVCQMSLILCVCVCVCVFFLKNFKFLLFFSKHIYIYMSKISTLGDQKQSWDCASYKGFLFLFSKKWHKVVIFLGEKKLNIVGFQRNSTLLSLSLDCFLFIYFVKLVQKR